MIKIFMLVLAILFTGCTSKNEMLKVREDTPKKIIIFNKPIPKRLTRIRRVKKPIPIEEFEKLNKDEQIKYLSNYGVYLLKTLKNEQLKLYYIRKWNEKITKKIKVSNQ